MPPTAARVRLSNEGRRSALLDAAAATILESGLEAVTMEGVSARTGASKTLGYHYFPNVEVLLVALFDRETAAFDAALAAEFDPAQDLEHQLRRLLDVYVGYALDRGELYRRLTQEQDRFADLAARQAQRRQQTDRFLGALLQSASSVGADDAELLAAMLLDATAGVQRIWHQRGGGIEDLRALVDTFVDVCLAAVRAVEARHS